LKKIEYISNKLENGLEYVLCKDNRNPLTNLMIGYKVGSKDEPEGKKGVAHLFEHLMFQGSCNVKKNEHFSTIQYTGGECNAFTSQDITVYYDKLPSNHLETGLWLESDRMISLNLTEQNLQNQKEVVIEEKLSRYDNAPYGTAFLNILKNVFKGSCYETSTIGKEDDIRIFSVDDAKNFHETFYSPSNALLILTGDFEYNNAEKLIEKYFGSIKKNSVLNKLPVDIAPLKKIDRFTVYDDVNLQALYICYMIPKVGSPEEFSLEYFVNLLANRKSSVLYKRLVYEKKLLSSIHIDKYQTADSGILVFGALLNEGTECNEIEFEINKAIDEFYKNDIKDSDFNKIRNDIEYLFTINHSHLMNINMDLLHGWFYYNDLNEINKQINKYLSVNTEDVKRAVNDYIIDKPNLTMTYLPKEK
jgi:zinc protease